MKEWFCALIAVAVTGQALGQGEIAFHLKADMTVLNPWETAHYELWAEWIDPPAPSTSIRHRATMSNMGFDLTFGGTDLFITNNDFSTAFDSVFWGPANDGTVIGDSIIGAAGTNELPPLNNPGGPDASNPLFIFGFTADGRGLGEASYTPSVTLVGNVTGGAYVIGCCVEVIQVLNFADGSPGNMPYSFVYDTITYIPTPATGTIALISFAALRRRSR